MQLDQATLDDDYFSALHDAYNAMCERYRKSGLSSKQIANQLGESVARVDRCLSGKDTLTLETMAKMASAMQCRVKFTFVPYGDLR